MRGLCPTLPHRTVMGLRGSAHHPREFGGDAACAKTALRHRSTHESLAAIATCAFPGPRRHAQTAPPAAAPLEWAHHPATTISTEDPPLGGRQAQGPSPWSLAPGRPAMPRAARPRRAYSAGKQHCHAFPSRRVMALGKRDCPPSMTTAANSLRRPGTARCLGSKHKGAYPCMLAARTRALWPAPRPCCVPSSEHIFLPVPAGPPWQHCLPWGPTFLTAASHLALTLKSVPSARAQM